MANLIIKYIPLLAISLTTLTACGGGETNNTVKKPPAGYSISDNGINSAILTGVSLGLGKEENSNLRKIVPVQLLQSNTFFEVGNAYIIKSTTSSSSVLNSIIEITNISDILRCVIKAENISYFDNNSSVLLKDTGHFLFGTVAFLESNNSYTNTCLNPGEKGYVVSISTNQVSTIYNDITNIQIGAISHLNKPYQTSPISVLPTSYNLTSSNSINFEFNVTVENLSNKYTVLNPFSIYFLLDENNQPLYWRFLDIKNSSFLSITAGQSSSSLYNNTSYNGKSDKIQINLTFFENTPSPPTVTGISTDLTTAYSAFSILESDDPVTLQKKLLDKRNRINEQQFLSIKSRNSL